jgi:hypothetical protein
MSGYVGVASDVPQLLRNAGHRSAGIEVAIANQWLWRRKVEGVWLYGTTEDAIDAGEKAVSVATMDVLAGWLLGPLHPLSGYISKHLISLLIGKNAVQALLKSMLRHEQLDGIAIFTSQHQPYLAAFRPVDRDEISRQIGFLRRKIQTDGRVSGADLPDPVMRTTLRAWRDVVVRHGEYIGLGYMRGGALVTWQ